MDFSRFDLWIFDCDGVLLDSNSMKSQAFAEVLSGYDPELVTRFLAFQRTTFGLSRFRSLAMFFSDFLNYPAEPGEQERLLGNYGRFCAENYPRQSVTEGTLALLEGLKGRGKRAYVASGSEQFELRAALDVIGIAPYFVEILGSPRKKVDLIGEILKGENNPDPQRVIFLGDATADHEAATANGLPFLQVEAFSADPAGMTLLREKFGFPMVSTLSDVKL